jgi:ketopantoate reductase
MLGRPGKPSAHLEALARDGLRMKTVSFDERVHVETSTRTEAIATAELVLFCVKTVAVNSMANATSALTDKTYGSLARFEPTWNVAIDVAREAVAVARADGHELSLDSVVEQGLAICRSVGAATSSTQQDVARGRPTEIDALNGYIARRGAELGIETPVNRTLWALVKLRERSES